MHQFRAFMMKCYLKQSAQSSAQNQKHRSIYISIYQSVSGFICTYGGIILIEIEIEKTCLYNHHHGWIELDLIKTMAEKIASRRQKNKIRRVYL